MPTNRHPSVASVRKWLTANPNLPDKQHTIATLFEKVADALLNDIETDSPELSAGLRKLLEAKDCFVRASMEDDN